jgi:hypothetical protein
MSRLPLQGCAIVVRGDSWTSFSSTQDVCCLHRPAASSPLCLTTTVHIGGGILPLAGCKGADQHEQERDPRRRARRLHRRTAEDQRECPPPLGEPTHRGPWVPPGAPLTTAVATPSQTHSGILEVNESVRPCLPTLVTGGPLSHAVASRAMAVAPACLQRGRPWRQRLGDGEERSPRRRSSGRDIAAESDTTNTSAR